MTNMKTLLASTIVVGLAAALHAVGESSGSCIVSGSTNRVEQTSQTRTLTTGVDSFWQDVATARPDRFRRGPAKGMVLIVR